MNKTHANNFDTVKKSAVVSNDPFLASPSGTKSPNVESDSEMRKILSALIIN